MAIVCPPKSDVERRTKIMNNLKEIFDSAEDQIAMPCDLLGGVLEDLNDKSSCPPKPPDVMVCYKVTCKSKNDKSCSNASNGDECGKKKDNKKLKPSKSRELRWGILYMGCDCEKRNGLQDDCRRTGCQGSPKCLTLPEPTCGPSEFSNAKHLEKKKQKRLKLLQRLKQGGDIDDDSDDSDQPKYKYKCFPGKIKNQDKECC